MSLNTLLACLSCHLISPPRGGLDQTKKRKRKRKQKKENRKKENRKKRSLLVYLVTWSPLQEVDLIRQRKEKENRKKKTEKTKQKKRKQKKENRKKKTEKKILACLSCHPLQEVDLIRQRKEKEKENRKKKTEKRKQKKENRKKRSLLVYLVTWSPPQEVDAIKSNVWTSWFPTIWEFWLWYCGLWL